MIGPDPAQRCEMVRDARVVLCRHLIDIGSLQISIGGRCVYLVGQFKRLTGTDAPLTPALVGSIMRELNSLPRIAAVHTDFDNWKDAGGGCWVEEGALRRSVTGDGKVLTYDLEIEPQEEVGT